MNAPELSKDRVLNELKHIVQTSEELLHATKDAVGDTTEELRERLTEALDTARRTCQRLEGEAIKGAKAADRVVRDHPYESIGTAFGIGLLIGVLVSRK